MERHGMLNTKIPKLHSSLEALRDIKHQTISNIIKSHCSTWHGNAPVILDNISTQSQGQWRTKNLHLQRFLGYEDMQWPCYSTSGIKGARLASETSAVARFERNIARLWETVGIPLVTVLVLLSFVFSLIKESGVVQI